MGISLYVVLCCKSDCKSPYHKNRIKEKDETYNDSGHAAIRSRRHNFWQLYGCLCAFTRSKKSTLPDKETPNDSANSLATPEHRHFYSELNSTGPLRELGN